MQRPSPVRNSVIARGLRSWSPSCPALASPPRAAQNPPRRAGFTLIEVLVAMAVTLMLMAIVVTIFGAIGENVSKNNSSMEMNDQLRSVKQRLQLDLSGVTVQMLPPRRDENGEGYFEIIEGPVGRLPPNTAIVISETLLKDPQGTPGPPGPDTTVGDNDDILMLTTRSKGEMFLGRGVMWNSSTSMYVPTALQSQVAEVAWFIRGTTLYRRQLLVRPDLPTTTTINGQYVVPQPNNLSGPPYFQSGGTSPYAFTTNFYAITDISARAAGAVPSGVSFDLSPSPPNFYVVANSLEDLTKRENRFAHCPLVAGTSPYGWPHDVRGWGIFYSATPFGIQQSLLSGGGYPNVATSGRLGLPTLQECSSPYWLLPGATDISATHQVFLGDQSGNGTTTGSRVAEPFDAWTNPFPAWTTLYNSSGAQLSTTFSPPATRTTDPLTGALTTYFPAAVSTTAQSPPPYGSRYGEDVIMTHVLSFDVRVWDPDAALISVVNGSTGDVALYAPGDPGYAKAAVNFVLGAGSPTIAYAILSRGAYVDLYYTAAFPAYLIANSITLSAAQSQALTALTGSTFSGAGNPNSGLNSPDPFTASVYDTGSWHYENDGINQGPMVNPNGVTTAIVDEGTNGLDDNNDGVVDDVGELEAPPPYSAPLRGIQIKIRCFDADSQEIREVTVVQEFVPE